MRNARTIRFAVCMFSMTEWTSYSNDPIFPLDDFRQRQFSKPFELLRCPRHFLGLFCIFRIEESRNQEECNQTVTFLTLNPYNYSIYNGGEE